MTALSVASSSNFAVGTSGRGYNVAVGKGVRHQLNGYLRKGLSPKDIKDSPTQLKDNFALAAAAPSATATTTTTTI